MPRNRQSRIRGSSGDAAGAGRADDFLGILCLIAVLACLYVAQDIVVPVVLALVLKLLLQPLVSLLERLHLPRAAGALIALAVLLLA